MDEAQVGHMSWLRQKKSISNRRKKSLGGEGDPSSLSH